MEEHGKYWASLAEEGVALLLDPVRDPPSSDGIGIVEAENGEDVEL